MIMSSKAEDKLPENTNTAGVPANFGIPGAGHGILHPTMKHKFRLVFPTAGEAMKMITMQVTDVTMRVIEKHMIVNVEQPAVHTNQFMGLIERLAQHSTDFRLEFLDGNEGVVGEIAGYAELIEHELRMDYAVSEAATHYLVFKYTRGLV